METISLKFTPTGEDYVNAVRHSNERNPANYVAAGLLALLGALAVCNFILRFVFIPSIFETRDAVLAGGVIILIAAVMFLAYVIAPWLIRRSFKKNERLRAPQTWELSDESVRIYSAHTDIKTDWAMFHRVMETKISYLLVLSVNKVACQFIPKRAFTSPEHEAAFRALVEKHLGQIKN
jgi:hypothetical protein